MILLVNLILAHLISDFPLQNNWIYQFKVQSRWGILLHCCVHCIVTTLLIDIKTLEISFLILLLLSHFIIDWFKIHYVIVNDTISFLLDQGLHLLVLTTLIFLFPQIKGILPIEVAGALMAYALAPAILVFAWVYASEQVSQDRYSSASNLHFDGFLSFSQVVGSPLIGLLFAVTLWQLGSLESINKEFTQMPDSGRMFHLSTPIESPSINNLRRFHKNNEVDWTETPPGVDLSDQIEEGQNKQVETRQSPDIDFGINMKRCDQFIPDSKNCPAY